MSVVLHLIFLSVTPHTPALNKIPKHINQERLGEKSPISAVIRAISNSSSPPVADAIQSKPEARTQKKSPEPPIPESLPVRLASTPDHEIWGEQQTLRGEIRLKIWVDRYGTPRRLEVIQSTLAREIEEQIVVRFYSARYFPAEKNGEKTDGIAEFHIVVGNDSEDAADVETKTEQDSDKR